MAINGTRHTFKRNDPLRPRAIKHHQDRDVDAQSGSQRNGEGVAEMRLKAVAPVDRSQLKSIAAEKQTNLAFSFFIPLPPPSPHRTVSLLACFSVSLSLSVFFPRKR